MEIEQVAPPVAVSVDFVFSIFISFGKDSIAGVLL